MYSIKKYVALEKLLKEYLNYSVTSELKKNHYYVFHTQFDAYFCTVGRITVQPFAIAKMDEAQNLIFCRSHNRFPGSAKDLLRNNVFEYLWDVTETVNTVGINQVISLLDTYKYEYENNYDLEIEI